ncbi:MAG: tetratricopeptide repeat protein, partial [Myxococcota bacterium]
RGVPLRRIRRSVESLRRRFPDLDRPLDALRVWMDGSDRMVVRHQGVLLEPNGQTVIDFSPTPPAGGSGVAPLAPRERTESAAGRALEWFERGCHNDSDPATYATAVEAYRRAIEAAPDFADAHCNLGSVYFNLERRAAARACFERAIALEARHLEANLNLATLLEEDGRNEAALSHYKVALETEPLYPDTHVSLALLYEKLSLRRKARSHWRRYLQLDPTGGWAHLARRRLEE